MQRVAGALVRNDEYAFPLHLLPGPGIRHAHATHALVLLVRQAELVLAPPVRPLAEGHVDERAVEDHVQVGRLLLECPLVPLHGFREAPTVVVQDRHRRHDHVVVGVFLIDGLKDLPRLVELVQLPCHLPKCSSRDEVVRLHARRFVEHAVRTVEVPHDVVQCAEVVHRRLVLWVQVDRVLEAVERALGVLHAYELISEGEQEVGYLLYRCPLQPHESRLLVLRPLIFTH